MNQKAHRLRWALFFGCSSELNSDMTIDLSDTSLSQSTSFNSLIQQLAEKVFPSALYLIRNGVAENGWTKVDVTNGFTASQQVNTIRYVGNTSGVNTCRFEFNGDLGSYSKLVVEYTSISTDGIELGFSSSNAVAHNTMISYVPHSYNQLVTNELSVPANAVCIALATDNVRSIDIKNMYLQ